VVVVRKQQQFVGHPHDSTVRLVGSLRTLYRCINHLIQVGAVDVGRAGTGRRIARRPWPAGDAEDAAEPALRRRSAEAAVAGYGILVVTMTAGYAGWAFGTTMNTGCQGLRSVNVMATAFGFASLFGLLCLVVYLVQLAAPPTWSRA
jgi:hypothetical protein